MALVVKSTKKARKKPFGIIPEGLLLCQNADRKAGEKVGMAEV